MSADLSAIGVWLFDLDNTLYPPDTGFMRQIERRMTAFVARETGLEPEAALALQKRYLEEHGTTLSGLMRRHGVDPRTFLDDVHDVPLDVLTPDPALAAAIGRLPGRRLIFTNGDDRHAARVLDRLGLGGLFEDVFHIESAGYVPKPEPDAFARLVAAHAFDPREAAFFEDVERNLEPAAGLGMTTVLVGPHAEASRAPFVHHRAPRLAPFLEAARTSGDPTP